MIGSGYVTKDEMGNIYDKYKNSVYRLAFAYCKNSADAEDVMQDVFIKRFSCEAVFADEAKEKKDEEEDQCDVVTNEQSFYLKLFTHATPPPYLSLLTCICIQVRIRTMTRRMMDAAEALPIEWRAKPCW